MKVQVKVQGARCRISVDSKTSKHGFRDSRCSQREEALSECRRFQPLFAVPDAMSTRRGRDDQVATSLTTLGHSQQDRTKCLDVTRTHHVSKDTIHDSRDEAR